MRDHTRSEALFNEAVKYIPGGVNSPVRAFGSVGATPIFIEEASGAHITDVDGNVYIDYVCSWGPLILGHCSEVASQGVMEVLAKGTTYGMPTGIETRLAATITDHIEAVEMIRMVSSGTEATMSALRLARGYTGRNKIIKFQGCYHGHSDGLLVKSGSGALTGGVATSAGVPEGIIAETLVAQFNDIESVRHLMEAHEGDVAAVIVEPIPGNMGLVEAAPGFLQDLRDLTSAHGTLLIFDEVISGFRIAYEGAAGYYGILPDLMCFGKIIGGGMPVGAYGGKKEIMNHIAPLGGVYQAGTLSGNPLAMRMGLNVLTYLKAHPETYDRLTDMAIFLEKGFRKNLEDLDISGVTINRVGGMLCQFFAAGPIDSYESVMASDTDQYAAYFKAMLDRGILLPPAQYECLFLSAAHGEEELTKTLEAHYEAMKLVKSIWPNL